MRARPTGLPVWIVTPGSGRAQRPVPTSVSSQSSTVYPVRSDSPPSRSEVVVERDLGGPPGAQVLDHLLGRVRRAASREARRGCRRARPSRGARRVPVAVPHRVDRLVGADAAEVDLSRRDARVAEGVAHDVEGRARADEVDCERVA